jgi:hypothetical protein
LGTFYPGTITFYSGTITLLKAHPTAVANIFRIPSTAEQCSPSLRDAMRSSNSSGNEVNTSLATMHASELRSPTQRRPATNAAQYAAPSLSSSQTCTSPAPLLDASHLTASRPTVMFDGTTHLQAGAVHVSTTDTHARTHTPEHAREYTPERATIGKRSSTVTSNGKVNATTTTTPASATTNPATNDTAANGSNSSSRSRTRLASSRAAAAADLLQYDTNNYFSLRDARDNCRPPKVPLPPDAGDGEAQCSGFTLDSVMLGSAHWVMARHSAQDSTEVCTQRDALFRPDGKGAPSLDPMAKGRPL